MSSIISGAERMRIIILKVELKGAVVAQRAVAPPPHHHKKVACALMGHSTSPQGGLCPDGPLLT